MKEYFSRLYLAENATYDEVKAAYRKLAKKFHPDMNLDNNEFEEEFKLIQEAYQKLNSYFQSNSKSNKTYQSTNPGNTSDTKNNTHDGSFRSQQGYQQNTKQEQQSYSQGTENKPKRKFVVCRKCSKGFWADRIAGVFANCPYCNEINSSGYVPFASKIKVTDTQSYYCDGCKNEFYANVCTHEKVFCPYCYAKCTLPKNSMGFKIAKKGTYGFYCPGCNKIFYADRKKYNEILCPHCYEIIILPIITFYEGYLRQVPYTQGYICGTCHHVFYADISRTTEAICPHCRFANTLPFLQNPTKSIDPLVALIYIIIGIMIISFLFS